MNPNRPAPIIRKPQDTTQGTSAVVSQYRLLPKRANYSKVQLPDKNQAVGYLTNYYPYQQKVKGQDCLYTYTIDTWMTNPKDPKSGMPVEANSHKVWDQIVAKITKKYNRQMGIITHRNNTIWAAMPNKGQVIQKFMIGPRGRSSNIEIKMTMTGTVDLSNVYDQNNKSAKPAYVQMVNNKVKETMRKEGFADMGKGKYYANSEIATKQGMHTSNGLFVTKGFKFTLVCMQPQKNYMLVDNCTRIMQTKTFLDVILDAKQNRSLPQINEMFRGATLIARYGNHNTYKLEQIEFNMSQHSTFKVGPKGKERDMSYVEYFKQQYQIDISTNRQPLIKAIARVDTKMEKDGKKTSKTPKGLFLIPELVSLVGMNDQQRHDQKVMREVATETRMRPLDRFNSVADLIKPLVSSSKLFNVAPNPWRVEGYKLISPEIQLKDQRVKVDSNGEFNFKQKVLEPMRFPKNEWIFAYSSRVQNEAFGYYKILQEASATFGINFEDPLPVKVDYEELNDPAKMTQAWCRNLLKASSFIQNKTQKSAKVVLLLGEGQDRFYSKIKNFCTLTLKVKTQFFKKSTLDRKAMSAGGKIGLQIVAKEGNTLWTVPPQHKYWAGKRVGMASFTYSKSLKHSFTMALVGTINSQQSAVYSECTGGLKGREQAPSAVYHEFIFNWLENYFMKERQLPTTLIIYREGLSEDMIKKTVGNEIDQINKSLQKIQKLNPKFADFHPEIAIFSVNKRVNTRFYDMIEKRPVNPTSGSVVFCEFASSDMVDFYLVAQKVTEGTATPTQYRLVFYHPGGRPLDPEEKKKPLEEKDKCELPLNALAQLTYEQCFNYYNWQGAVKVPAVMQCANKVSKMIGEHIKNHVNLIRFTELAREQIEQAGETLKDDAWTKRMNELKREALKMLSSYYFL